jgi:4-hydroxy-3-methylbut-2-enyl diphosphate reductase
MPSRSIATTETRSGLPILAFADQAALERWLAAQPRAAKGVWIKFAKKGYTIVLIGHKDHDEVIGTMGEAPASITLVESDRDVKRLPFTRDAKVAYLTQTTLSVDEAQVIIDALKRRYPQIAGPSKDDICYATQNRQEAIRELVPEADLVLVLGSQNSSNSLRMTEVARSHGKPAHLVDGVAELKDEWFKKAQVVRGPSSFVRCYNRKPVASDQWSV